MLKRGQPRRRFCDEKTVELARPGCPPARDDSGFPNRVGFGDGSPPPPPPSAPSGTHHQAGAVSVWAKHRRAAPHPATNPANNARTQRFLKWTSTIHLPRRQPRSSRSLAVPSRQGQSAFGQPARHGPRQSRRAQGKRRKAGRRTRAKKAKGRKPDPSIVFLPVGLADIRNDASQNIPPHHPIGPSRPFAARKPARVQGAGKETGKKKKKTQGPLRDMSEGRFTLVRKEEIKSRKAVRERVIDDGLFIGRVRWATRRPQQP